MLAAIHFGVRSPGFFGVAAGLLQHVSGIKPALQVPPAELPFLILFVAGALPGLLYFDLMMGKLRDILGAGSGHFASRQRTYPSLERRQAFSASGPQAFSASPQACSSTSVV